MNPIMSRLHGLLAALLCLPGVAAPLPAVAETYNIIATNGSFQSRRSFGGGLYDAVTNRTFVVWNGPGMDLYARTYDHNSGAWGSALKIADWDDSSTYAYHDYTTLVLMPDGRLAVFICDHTKAAYMIKAPNERSIGGTWTKTRISTDLNTYPMPVVHGSTVYFFYSRNDDLSWPYRQYRMIRTTNNGTSWTSPVVVIDTGKTSDRMNEVYASGVFETGGRIYISFTLAGGGGHNERSQNLYLTYYDTANGQMHSPQGESLGTTVYGATEIGKTLVRTSLPPSTGTYDELHPIFYSQPMTDSSGTMFIGFGETIKGTGKYIRYGKLVNGSWTFGTIASGTAEFLDMVRTGTNHFEFLYTDDASTRIINRRLNDGGASQTTLYDLPVSYGSTNANKVVNANFITNRSTIRAVGTTINDTEETSDYSGKWPIFTIQQ